MSWPAMIRPIVRRVAGVGAGGTASRGLGDDAWTLALSENYGPPLAGSRGVEREERVMTESESAGLDPGRDFPLATHRSELIRTPTGKRLEELTLGGK
jgi:hypothetical protein